MNVSRIPLYPLAFRMHLISVEVTLLRYRRLGTAKSCILAPLLPSQVWVVLARGPLGRQLLANAANGMENFTLPDRTPPVLPLATTYPTKLSAVPPLPLEVPPPIV